MAKKAYIGVSGKARKVKKAYIGISGKARKVKKVYIGVGGKARPCFSAEELVYLGQLPGIARQYFSAVVHANHWLFAGGLEAATSKQVDKINSDFVISRITDLIMEVCESGTAQIGLYALIAGGMMVTPQPFIQPRSETNAYDTSFVRTSGPSIPGGRVCGTTLGNHALFHGYYDNSYFSSTVYAVTGDLVRSTLANLNWPGNGYSRCAANSAYALFYGDQCPDATVYNVNLVKSTPPAPRQQRARAAIGTLNDHLLIVGGMNSPQNTYVDIYSASLVHTTPVTLSIGRYSSFVGEIKNRMLVLSGYSSTPAGDYAEQLDANFVSTLLPDVSPRADLPTGGCNNDTLIYAGGNPYLPYFAYRVM